MKPNRIDLNKVGIYCIRNLVTNKVYIGKSTNIYNRIASHISELNRKSKNENRHLINAWHKYGSDSFDYYVLEYLDLDESLLKERELYWMEKYNSTNSDFGYNLRKDSSTKMIMHEETKALLRKQTGSKNPNYGHKWSYEQKQRMSNIKKQQYRDGVVKINKEGILKGVHNRNKMFIEHPEKLQKMKDKLQKINTKYKIYQYDKNTMELVRIWDFIADIIKENPSYKRHNIYAVCSGEKKSMYGYVWVKVLNDDIVQTDTKVLE